jgi:organic radical activating enzyme
MFYHSLNIGFIEIPNTNASLNIYTVGCPFKCNGCHNPDLQNLYHPERKQLTSLELEKYIDNSNGFINGICWLGGEPLFQFKDFIAINHKLRTKYKDIIIALYTGYTISNIKNDNLEEYLALRDIELNYIIDGQWNGFPLSHEKTNQKIYKFDYNLNDYIEITYKDFMTKKIK